MFDPKRIGLDPFLKDYPEMRILPTVGDTVKLSGTFSFSGEMKNFVDIVDSYELEIVVPSGFPSEVPTVTEIKNKIPRDNHHHVNPDGTLCLGSPVRLLMKTAKGQNLVGFADNCLVPYLYAISHKMKFGAFPAGELAHGSPGALQDYVELFGLYSEKQALIALTYLCYKKNRVNKKPCPCGCGKRLGACRYHFKLLTFRRLTSRSWFRRHLSGLI